MGFRFRKSFKIGPFRTTLSKSGVSSSVGFKGFRYTFRADGKRQKTFSLPGTGLSFVDISKSDATSHDNKQISESTSRHQTNWGIKIFAMLLVLFVLFLIIQALIP